MAFSRSIKWHRDRNQQRQWKPKKVFIYLFMCISLLYIHMYIYIWYSPVTDFRSSRKLAWVWFEPTTTEFRFRSDTLTDWAIRPWVQLTFRPNFVQLLQFHLFVQCLHFTLAIAFVGRRICFKRNFAQLITLVAEWIDTYGSHHWKILEVAIESWPEWDLNPRPLNSIQTLSLSLYIYTGPQQYCSF